jgi:penicillin-insensitive murein endopeptidase
MPGLWQRDPPFPYLPGENRTRSRSIGGVVHGHLVNSVSIPQPHPSLTFLDVQYQRRLFYTTDRMRDLVVGAAEHVRDHHPEAVVRLGNFGNPGGGDIPYSVSHNSGRDADLAFFMVGPDGEPAVPEDLAPLDNQGRYETDFGTYRFDPERNWRLIEGVIEHGGDQLQYIFVSRPLRRMLLAEARRQGADREVRRRARALLHQPYGSLPHDDHFHIRIYCSAIDVASGCWDRGTKHPWYSAHRGARRRALERALEGLEAEEIDVRVAAARRLGMMGDSSEVDRLVDALADDSGRVRAAAARALGRLDSGTEALVARLDAESDDQAYLEVVDALGRIGGGRAVEALTGELGEARAVSLPGGVETDGRTFVAEALIRLEDGRPVEELVGLLENESEAVRRASMRALHFLTNQRLVGSDGAAEGDGVVEAWRSWLDEHADQSREVWLRDGFKRAGYEVDRLDARHVWGLTRAITDVDYLSHNAQRVLMEISGRQPRSLHWPKEDASFYWRRWFERRHQRLGAPPVPEELSTLD